MVDANDHGGSFEAPAPRNPFRSAFNQALAAAAAEDEANSSSSGSPEHARPYARLDFASPAAPDQTQTTVQRQPHSGLGPDLDPASPLNPNKRLRMSDLHTPRYAEEFFELADAAKGQYGQVKIVRHRLDGMVYAVKIAPSRPVPGSACRERAIMNEIFANAALMKHKHVVRYYTSWVENNVVYIQCEYCEGGSLADDIAKRREQNKPYTESELRTIATHLVKGLQYIHSKGLVHLDVKPDNVLLSIDHMPACFPSDDEDDEDGVADAENGGKKDAATSMTPPEAAAAVGDCATATTTASAITAATPTPVNRLAEEPHRLVAAMRESEEDPTSTPRSSRKKKPAKAHESTDSGHHSDGKSLVKAKPASAEGVEADAETDTTNAVHHACGNQDGANCPGGQKDRVFYKIGDLGHVAAVHGDYVPEEGDCRYMAPELLADDDGEDREKLPKADVFSLALTLYECATLTPMPKNSTDGELYERLRQGHIPPVGKYGKDFSHMIALMATTDPLSRPSATRVLSHPFIKFGALRRRCSPKQAMELFDELKSAKEKVKELEFKLAQLQHCGPQAPEASLVVTPPKKTLDSMSEVDTDIDEMPAEDLPYVVDNGLPKPFISSAPGAPLVARSATR